MFLDNFIETIDEIGFWALEAIKKGISDVNMEISADTRPIDGSIVVNKVGNTILMKGYLSGPSRPNQSGDMAAPYSLIDFDLEWIKLPTGDGQVAKYHQRQIVNGLNSKKRNDMVRHRRQAKQGIVPMDYHQSLNRKQIIGQYYDDGGLVYE
jgi:hypothetical protein